ncbi:MAG: DUF2092 domain-containing protein [Oligoflexus sp.]
MLKKFIPHGSFGIAVVQVFIGTSLYAGETSQDPFALLKKATTLLQSSEYISAKGNASTDVIDDEELKVQRNFSLEVVVQRPNKIYTIKAGDENQKSFFDGSMFTVLNTEKNVYAQKDINGTIDDLVLSLEQENISAPLADLLLSNFYELLEDATRSAKYLGETTILGQSCSHLAFRTSEIDWQVWIAMGEQATICRSLITSKRIAGAPQYEVTFQSWNFGDQIDENIFQFSIPQDAMEVEFIPGQLGFNE